MHPIYNDQAKIDRGIRELEKRLHTTSLARAEEAIIIKEIKQVKDSVPYFKKMDAINRKISDLKKERAEIQADLPQINKIAGSIKAKISKVKESDNGFANEKKLYQLDLVNVNSAMETLLENISELRTQKRNLKEDFYGQLCDYEIQQAFIKDIIWITKTKEMVTEREERREMLNAERREKREHWKRVQEERAKQEEEYRARQEERRKREEERKREWELEQLSRLAVHPYKQQIEACEQLIYFCAKNRKTESQQATEIEELKEASDEQRREAAEKKLED